MEWSIERSRAVTLPHGGELDACRSAIWFMMEDGEAELNTLGTPVGLLTGDAAYLHRAALHRVTVGPRAKVLIADLRYEAPGRLPDPLVVRNFADTQAGVVSLISHCPVDTDMKLRRPTVGAAYGELLGTAMLAEAQDAGARARPHLGDPLVARVAVAVTDAPEAGWSLEGMATLAHLGTSALVERFRAATGLSPMQYVRRARILLASDRLAASDAAIASIAPAVGYRSAAAFGRAFRAVTGCTPQRWRQSLRGETLMQAKPTAASAAVTIPS